MPPFVSLKVPHLPNLYMKPVSQLYRLPDSRAAHLVAVAAAAAAAAARAMISQGFANSIHLLTVAIPGSLLQAADQIVRRRGQLHRAES